MIQHRLTVNKDIIEPIPLSIPSGNVETHELVFDFSNEWDGLKKMAVFTRDGVSKEYTIDGATRTVPGDVLTEPGTLSVGVYGYIVDGEKLVKRLSTNIINLVVIKGAYASADPGEDVPPSAYEQLSTKVDDHIADKDNPHKVTASQVGAYSKAETDTKLAGKLDKVKSLVRVYPGVYATESTDGTPQLITATSDLSYIGTSSGYIPLYAPGGQLKTAEPTEDDAATNKGYVDTQIANNPNADKLEKVIAACCDTKIVSGGNYNFLKVSEVSFSSRLQDDVAGIVSSTAQNAVTGWIPVLYGKYYALSIKINGERTTYSSGHIIQRINTKKSDGTITVYNKYPEQLILLKDNQVAIKIPSSDVVAMMIHFNSLIGTDISTAEKLKALEPMIVEGSTAAEARENAITKPYLDGDAVVPGEVSYTLKHDDTKADKVKVSPYRRSVDFGVISATYYKGVGSSYAETTFTKNTTYSAFIGAFDELVSNQSGYVTKTTLGQASDNQNIYLYDFKPVRISNQKTAIPKIVIVAGQHGFEKSNIFGLYYFVDNLLNRWNQHPALEYLRNHVELQIIPILNTYGFDNLTYKNGNGVNLNRNYDSRWELKADPTSEQYGGAAPFDQTETQIVRTLLQSNTDASLVIDFHTNGSSSVAQYSYISYYGICQSTDSYYNRMLDAVSHQLASISANFNTDYALNNPNTIFGWLNNANGIGLLRDWATDNNFVGVLVEGFNGFPGETPFTGDVYKANEEILVNWLITALGYLKEGSL